MPPFSQNPQNNQEVKVDPFDQKVESISKKLKGVTPQEVKSTILKYFEDEYATGDYERGAYPDLDQEAYQDRLEAAKRIINTLEERCPEGLDRLEFDAWASRNVEKIHEEID